VRRAPGPAEQALTFGRFLLALPRFLREPIDLSQARDAVRGRLARREQNLLATARQMFFGLPDSPYRPLLELAGCSFADFEALVTAHGVEATLGRLREAGVYFTFEEYKGRAPVVRNGREIPVETWQFGNPFLNHYYRTSTSGSTGRATHTGADLAHLARQAELRMLMLEAHGILDAPFAIWRPALPSGSGMNNILRMARMGRPVDRWFTPMVPGTYSTPARYRAATEAILRVGRWSGVRMAVPEPVALGDAGRIVHYLVQTVRDHGAACLNTTVSCGLRVALVARETGASLAGVTLFVAGEPATPAKVTGMRAAGARVISDYGAAETGRIALGCPHSDEPGDMHLALDTTALIAFPRVIPESGETVSTFHVTSLTPTAPLQLLNLELDDFGVLDDDDCGCPLHRLGYTRRVRHVRSFRKLVGEGVTLIGSDMIRILEEVLPRRFGGSPLDYQLVEEEDARGFTRLSLRIDPRVDLEREDAVLEVVLDALRETSVAADMARAHWASAGSFRVVREPATVTERGKQAILINVPGMQA
jgi:hypothetical protein